LYSCSAKRLQDVLLYTVIYLKALALRSSILSFALILILFACPNCAKNKSCTPTTPASEYAQMQAYCTANGITPTVHSSGLFYQIINPGAGTSVSANSIIYITYTGKLMDGTVFDSQSSSAATGWALNQLIEGWKVGIPLIQKGGHIQLVVPSSMAYDCTGRGIIPGNSVLFFDITLVNVL
jgi:FKBP-type peptidyl-prolyl cis-trans isomerase FkpA